MTGFILLLNVIGWGVLALFIAPQNYDLGETGLFGLGVGLTAFLLGVRHAFDADHIAAIDNTTRKLVGEDKPALGVGFWFSLGHSSVVSDCRLYWPSVFVRSWTRCRTRTRRCNKPSG